VNVMDLFRLDGKVALVSGGAGMVGSAISEGLAEAGAKVIVASRNLSECEKRTKELMDRGFDAVAMRLDLSIEDSIMALRDSIISNWSKLDVLFNNAVSRAGLGLETMTREEWERTMKVNSTGLFLSCKILGTEMAKRRSGSIVNIASIYGLVGPDFRIYEGTGIGQSPANYAFAKGGMISFTRYLATYYARYNVRVNCICPGGYQGGQPETFVKKYVERTPLGRMAHKDDIKGVAVFFASDASAYITGQILPVDGGWTAW